MSLIFKKERDVNNDFDNTEVELRSESIVLSDILRDFEDFLRGCGFGIDGRIEIVEDCSNVSDIE